MEMTGKSSSATRDEILDDGAILCVRLTSGEGLVDICRAAARGGLRVLEITLTTPGALDAMKVLSDDSDLIVGGGTALSIEAVRQVAEAGGRFVLSPTFDAAVVDEAERLGLLAVPGASTPTEILAAHRHGAKLVKVFPAGALGGPGFIRAIRGPLPDIPLVATSGPDSRNMPDYFDAGVVAVGVGAEVFAAGLDATCITSAATRVRAAVNAARRSAR